MHISNLATVTFIISLLAIFVFLMYMTIFTTPFVRGATNLKQRCML